MPKGAAGAPVAAGRQVPRKPVSGKQKKELLKQQRAKQKGGNR
jgi:hypothetical protein